MRVRVLFFGEMRRLLPRGQSEVWVELADGARVSDALPTVGVAPGDERIVGLNGALAQDDTPLRDGDTLSLYHPMGGGAAAWSAHSRTASRALMVAAVPRTASITPGRAASSRRKAGATRVSPATTRPSA
jgi:molybdopterin converting factor small subunit